MKLVCRLFRIAKGLVLFFYHTAFYLEAQTGEGGTPYNSPKGVPFSGLRYMRGWGFYLLKYMEG